MIADILQHIELEPQHIEFNHLPDIDLRDIINLYNKCTAKPYSFFRY